MGNFWKNFLKIHGETSETIPGEVSEGIPGVISDGIIGTISKNQLTRTIPEKLYGITIEEIPLLEFLEKNLKRVMEWIPKRISEGFWAVVSERNSEVISKNPRISTRIAPEIPAVFLRGAFCQSNVNFFRNFFNDSIKKSLFFNDFFSKTSCSYFWRNTFFGTFGKKNLIWWYLYRNESLKEFQMKSKP